jgi:hypothetical protein
MSFIAQLTDSIGARIAEANLEMSALEAALDALRDDPSAPVDAPAAEPDALRRRRRAAPSVRAAASAPRVAAPEAVGSAADPEPATADAPDLGAFDLAAASVAAEALVPAEAPFTAGEVPGQPLAAATLYEVVPPEPATPGEATAADATAGEATAADATPGDAIAADATPGEAIAADATPGEGTATDAAPAEPPAAYTGSDSAAAEMETASRRPRLPRPPGFGRRAAVLTPEKLAEMLDASSEGMSAISISKESGAGYNQVLGLLRELEASGTIRRTGMRRTSLWRLVTDEERIAERAAELERLGSGG